MEATDTSVRAMFRVNITEYNTRDHYYALLTKAVAMEPDRIALTMTHGFLVYAMELSGVLIRLVRAWRTIHTGVDFNSTPPLRFTIEPLFANTDRVEVCVGESSRSDLDDPLMKLIKTLLDTKK
jgi:hypothetical protein